MANYKTRTIQFSDYHEGKYGPCVFYVKRKRMSDELDVNLVHVYALGRYVGHYIEMGWMGVNDEGLYEDCVFKFDKKYGCYMVEFGKGGCICSKPVAIPGKAVVYPARRDKNSLGMWNYVNMLNTWRSLYTESKKNKWKVSVLIEGTK